MEQNEKMNAETQQSAEHAQQGNESVNSQSNGRKVSGHFGVKFWGVVCLIVLAACYLVRSNHKQKQADLFDSDDYYRTELDCGLDYARNNGAGVRSGNAIIDRWTNEVLLGDLEWIIIEEGDSLIPYASRSKRGYFNLRQRTHHELDEKFVHAYVYSEGLALAESLDSLYILDTCQREIASYAKTGARDTEVNTYHKGHLPMLGDNGKLGLIDTLGVWVIQPEFDKISWALDEFWLCISDPLMINEETGEANEPHRMMLDSHLRVIIDGPWTYMMVTREGQVTVADQNHWQWHYDLKGNVIDDFVCTEIEQMKYSTGELRWVTQKDGDEVTTQQVEVEEYANLLCYVTSDSHRGLMSRDGKVVTPPIFTSVEPINRNLYLCKYEDDTQSGILLNEKGDRVKH